MNNKKSGSAALALWLASVLAPCAVAQGSSNSTESTSYWYTNPANGIGVQARRRNLAQSLITPIAPSVVSQAVKKVSRSSAGTKTRPAPELVSIDMLSAPPGQPIVIFGKNFSPKLSDNEVLIGGNRAEVVDATPTSVTAIMPAMYYPQWYVPVVAKSCGVQAAGKLTINVQQRVIENGGVPMF